MASSSADGERARRRTAAASRNGTPLQVAEEERRVAERREAAADVRHEEDEEDDRVRDVLALAVGLQQRPDEQHRGAGRADERGEERAQAEERGVRAGRGLEVALQQHAARDHEEAAEQHDERDVVARRSRRAPPATAEVERRARAPRAAPRRRACAGSTPRSGARRGAGWRSRAAWPRTGGPTRARGRTLLRAWSPAVYSARRGRHALVRLRRIPSSGRADGGSGPATGGRRERNAGACRRAPAGNLSDGGAGPSRRCPRRRRACARPGPGCGRSRRSAEAASGARSRSPGSETCSPASPPRSTPATCSASSRRAPFARDGSGSTYGSGAGRASFVPAAATTRRHCRAAPTRTADGRARVAALECAPRGRRAMAHFDVVVLGCGPAGERAAIQAARAGRRVAAVERAHVVGGTRVNWGTIPSQDAARERALRLRADTQARLHGIRVRGRRRDHGRRLHVPRARGRPARARAHQPVARPLRGRGRPGPRPLRSTRTRWR